ncbi:Fic family protein [Dactylosporangium aurantiacum]|uniref:Fic family protein n=1 Tax=Dactylosporangium aurantiacum TaxID=35754 RepID=A0A9Q9IJT5_9ACTN|nr:Fic/DOC family N-terminal domain-containing protein [Dactylosporangium aurantiacum]MDG6107591.1 Fic/DOC family N-terminal domain-containing protein [Dactylosporangium aurantiacum]UWZ54373.1 Fic family protein [Dactylosporangium aurantiacum]
MDLDALRRSQTGQLVPITGADLRTGTDFHYFAYVPNPLPASPALQLRTLDLATKAAMAVARLDQAVAQIPNPQLLVRPIIRREAVSTSALEGTYAAFDEVLEADFLAESQQTTEQREIFNYVRATETALRLLKTYPISRTLLGQTQKEIVAGTPDDSYEAGDLRRHQVAIGSKGRPVTDARLVPAPPGSHLEEGFSEWEKWINAENYISPIVKLALGHYQFEALHPYNNGNGRLGRLIMLLQLMQDGVLRQPVLSLAPWLDEHKHEYIEGLLDVSLTGDFDSWVSFISEGVRVQADDAVQATLDLVALKEAMVKSLRDAGVRSAALELAEMLIGFPVIDVPTAANLLRKPFETANQAVAKLVKHGILHEITGRRVNRLFMCNEVLRIVTGRRQGSNPTLF